MKRKLNSILLGTVAIAMGFLMLKSTLYFAASRIYHADECQSVFVARILALGQAQEYFTSISLFLMPLVWLAREAVQSAELFASARLVALLIFWLNLLLLALATGEKLASWRGLFAFVGAATLSPLWDYGFEIRHDNLLLTGLLFIWCLMRLRPPGIAAYAILGGLMVALLFTAFKSFVYTIPLALAFLVFPPHGVAVARWKLGLAWAIGAFAMFLTIRLAYGAGGVWDVYLSGFQMVSEASGGLGRFPPWKTLGRLLTQTPLLLALVFGAVVAVGSELGRRGRAALGWSGLLPETVFFLIALAALLVNPAPHPYNLVNLVPFAYLLAFRYGISVLAEVWAQPVFRPVILTLLVFAHFVPFYMATRRHLDWPNHRQENLMRVAEQLTDPVKDPVYDGIGMVPTRRSIHFHWFLHSLNINNFRKSGDLRVRDMLAENPAAVIIQSYRTDWLPEEDHEFIRQRYVPLADDFWVLGQMLPAGGGEFEIHHPGRYHLAPKEVSNLAGTYESSLKALLESRKQPVAEPKVEPEFVATLNGLPLTNRTVELPVGTYRLETAADCSPTVVWAGPKLKQAPRVSESDRRRLFVNWY